MTEVLETTTTLASLTTRPGLTSGNNSCELSVPGGGEQDGVDGGQDVQNPHGAHIIIVPGDLSGILAVVLLTGDSSNAELPLLRDPAPHGHC